MTEKLVRDTPLLLAAATKKPLIAQKLLEAGADPLERDAYGNNALDYAFSHKPTWQKMGVLESKYKPKEKGCRRRVLRQSIRSCLQRVLHQAYPLPPTEEYARMMCITTVANSLVYLEDTSLHERARTCFIELCFPPKDWIYTRVFNCAVCHKSPIREEVHICTLCFETYLCRICHESYVPGGEDANSAPESLRRLEQLEDNLKPVREILRVAATTEGVEPMKVINAIFSASADLKEWARKKFEEFSEWEEQDNNGRTYNAYEKPGQEILNILIKTWRMEDEIEGSTPQTTLEEFFLLQDKKLENYFRYFKHDKELTPFDCRGHEYLKIPENKEATITGRTAFGDDGSLTHDWLRALLDKFRHDDVLDGEGEMDCSQNTPVCDVNAKDLEGPSTQNVESELEGLQVEDESIISSSKTTNTIERPTAGTRSSSLLIRDPVILETNETDTMGSPLVEQGNSGVDDSPSLLESSPIGKEVLATESEGE
jgi:hypothetical protein